MPRSVSKGPFVDQHVLDKVVAKQIGPGLRVFRLVEGVFHRKALFVPRQLLRDKNCASQGIGSEIA